MKSLAHPEWPYVGTSFEWRGFAEHEGQPIAGTLEIHHSGGSCIKHPVIAGRAIYQKQHFGDLK